MKKFLFSLFLMIGCFFAHAQVSVTIDNVTSVTTGKVKGDLVTFTVSSPNNQVWGIGLSADLDGEHNGAGGIYDPYSASFTTRTYTIFVGFRGNPRERVYQVTVLFTPNPDYPDPNDVFAYVKSDPFTVAK